jgi:hypothetical protein
MLRLSSLIPTGIVCPRAIGYASHIPFIREAGGQPVDPTQQGKENGEESLPVNPDPAAGAPAADPANGGGANNAPKDKNANQPATQAPPTDTDQTEVDDTINNVSAETSAVAPDPSALDSNTGMAFLLSKLVGQAKATNTIDALAASFVDQLKLTDFAKFKEDTQKYSNVDGMAELTNSIANMIDHGKDKVNESEEEKEEAPFWKQFGEEKVR